MFAPSFLFNGLMMCQPQHLLELFLPSSPSLTNSGIQLKSCQSLMKYLSWVQLHEHLESSRTVECNDWLYFFRSVSFFLFFLSPAFPRSCSFAPLSVSLSALYKCFSCLRNRSICLQSLWLPCLHRSFSRLPHTFQLGPPSAATDTGKQYWFLDILCVGRTKLTLVLGNMIDP